jgi:hypothetical protein
MKCERCGYDPDEKLSLSASVRAQFRENLIASAEAQYNARRHMAETHNATQCSQCGDQSITDPCVFCRHGVTDSAGAAD